MFSHIQKQRSRFLTTPLQQSFHVTTTPHTTKTTNVQRLIINKLTLIYCENNKHRYKQVTKLIANIRFTITQSVKFYLFRTYFKISLSIASTSKPISGLESCISAPSCSPLRLISSLISDEKMITGIF